MTNHKIIIDYIMPDSKIITKEYLFGNEYEIRLEQSFLNSTPIIQISTDISEKNMNVFDSLNQAFTNDVLIKNPKEKYIKLFFGDTLLNKGTVLNIGYSTHKNLDREYLFIEYEYDN